VRFVALREFIVVGALAGFSIALGAQSAARPSGAPSESFPTIVSVAAGGYTGYAVLSNGHVWAWGDDLEGQIGDSGPWSSRPVPVEVPRLSAVIVMAGSGNSAFALRSDGKVWAWGDDSQGELADKSFTARQTPRPIPRLTAIKDIAAGAFSAYAIRDDGTAWAWGDNGFGQLGTGSKGAVSTIPQELARLTDVVSVRSGSADGYALLRDGTVWAWGDDSLKQLGGARCGASRSDRPSVCLGSSVPQQVLGLAGVVAIAAGGDSGYALRRDGTVWAWGDDEFGELGNGVRRLDEATPVRVEGLIHVVAIAAGSCSAYALLRNGTVWAWGRGDYGQLGNGSTADRTIPVRVKGLTGVLQVVAGGDMTFALTRDRTLWSWGANTLGQLGDGSEFNRDLPVRVHLLPGSARSN